MPYLLSSLLVDPEKLEVCNSLRAEKGALANYNSIRVANRIKILIFRGYS
jgi:hypothetical protein